MPWLRRLRRLEQDPWAREAVAAGLEQAIVEEANEAAVADALAAVQRSLDQPPRHWVAEIRGPAGHLEYLRRTVPPDTVDLVPGDEHGPVRLVGDLGRSSAGVSALLEALGVAGLAVLLLGAPPVAASELVDAIRRGDRRAALGRADVALVAWSGRRRALVFQRPAGFLGRPSVASPAGFASGSRARFAARRSPSASVPASSAPASSGMASGMASSATCRTPASAPWRPATTAVVSLFAVGLAVAALAVTVRGPGTAPRPPVLRPPRAEAPASSPAPPVPLPAPVARHRPASAYDPRHRVLVLFGGLVAGQRLPATDLGDTWLFDGHRWREVVSPGPSPRDGAALAFDGPSGRLLLFGGAAFAGNERVQYHDTWAWDGERWSKIDGAGGPDEPGVLGVGSVDHHALLAGSRTWEWDGHRWVPRGPTPAGLDLATCGPAGIAAVGLVVGPGGHAATEVWRGTAWETVPDPSPVVESLTATVTCLPGDRGTLLVEEAFVAEDESHQGGVWQFDGQRWTQAAPTAPDVVRAFDRTTPLWTVVDGAAALVGGGLGEDAYRHVAIWTGRGWRER